MALTGTVHPPAGATALMAVLDERVAGLGWFLVCPLLLGCGLMLAVAMLVNNVQRRFPYYWWSPGETGGFWKGRRGGQEEEGGDGDGEGGVGAGREGEKGHGGGGMPVLGLGKPQDEESSGSSSGGEPEVGGELVQTVSVMSGRGGEIVIRRGRVQIPEGLSLRPEEILSLEMLSERL